MDFISEKVSLKNYNSWKVGGEAAWLAEPSTQVQVEQAFQYAKDKGLDIAIIGEGTNLLVPEEGWPGLVISSRNFSKILREVEEDGRLKISCYSGTPKLQIMRSFLKRKLSPALFLSGLPGNVGGGIAMNAGVREDRAPREFCEITDRIEVFSVNEMVWQSFESHDLKWSYRSCEGWGSGFIGRVDLSWQLDAQADIPKKVVEANKLRKSKQPLDWPSCGSTFKNPSEQVSAGKLIQDAGLKGLSIGGAQVSELHGNFLINTGAATAKNFEELIELIIEKVEFFSGYRLHPEVKRLQACN